jgi:hypothetical protein
VKRLSDFFLMCVLAACGALLSSWVFRVPPDDPPAPATVLGGWERGVTCIAPVRLRSGAVVAVELDPRRCAVTAVGDVVTVLRRGERWLVR